jgi:hypothetical protein
MGLFSKRPASSNTDQQIENAKLEGGRRLNEIRDRIGNGTATREDKRVFNATQQRGGRRK